MKNQKNNITKRVVYIASNKKIDGIYNLNLLTINYKNIDIDLSAYDALIFTSKNGVNSFLNSKLKWKQIDSFAISNVTGNALKKSNSKLIYTGISGHGDEFAKELVRYLKDKKPLYIRAKKVVSNIVDILNQNDISCDEIITYETACSKSLEIKKLEKNSIIIFSSPSTIDCFFKNYKWDDSYTAIAIGDTTASYFPKDINIVISKLQTIESCVQIAKTL
ncbi:MAG: uroporphyrinogen-III synthase [Campylobacterota bacterium]|nr:uroporphyrinogen-III synthase [Campylobacterota bacterium]